MAYSRGKYYIWSDGKSVEFCCDGNYYSVPNDLMDVFLYNITKSHRNEQLKSRIENGKQLSLDAEYEKGFQFGKVLSEI